MLTRFSVARCCCDPVREGDIGYYQPAGFTSGYWNIGVVRREKSTFVGWQATSPGFQHSFLEYFPTGGNVVQQGATIVKAELAISKYQAISVCTVPSTEPFSRDDQGACSFGGWLDIRFSAEDADASILKLTPADYDNAPRTTANTLIRADVAVDATGAGASYTLSDAIAFDVTSVMQELVDRPGFNGYVFIYIDALAAADESPDLSAFTVLTLSNQLGSTLEQRYLQLSVQWIP